MQVLRHLLKPALLSTMLTLGDVGRMPAISSPLVALSVFTTARTGRAAAARRRSCLQQVERRSQIA